MPHFVVECSENAIVGRTQQEINQEIHKVAVQSGLFKEKDIKVRCNPYDIFLVSGKPDEDFIHVFANIMSGRTTEQKAQLSKAVVGRLKDMFPKVNFIAMNVGEFEKATYCNLKTL